MRLLVQARATTIEYSDLQLTPRTKKSYTTATHWQRHTNLLWALLLVEAIAHLSSWKLFVQFTPISL